MFLVEIYTITLIVAHSDDNKRHDIYKWTIYKYFS